MLTPYEITALTYIALAVGLINICLLLGLLYSYWKTYKELESKFTVGLIFFASFLLFQNLLASIFIAIQLILPSNFNGSELGKPVLPLFFINLIQLVALSILLKITRS
jgi:nitric oxide reductase large subunit